MSTDVASLVSKVNQLLQAGEPGNISVDEHSGYTGYRPQAVIDAMNEAFGIGGWGFEEVSSEIVPGEKGGLAISNVQAWLTGIEFRAPAWGQNRVTRGDIGDAKKGAQTDALKKALSYFSIGNRAYHGLLEKKPAARPQVTSMKPVVVQAQPASVKAALYERGKAKGMWGKPEVFYAACSAVLDKPVNAASWSELTAKEIMQVERMIDNEPAVRKTA